MEHPITTTYRAADACEEAFKSVLALHKLDRWYSDRATWPLEVWDAYQAKLKADAAMRAAFDNERALARMGGAS